MNFLSFIRRNVDFFALLVTSLITHLFLFGYPREAVFDEVYFTSFISNYFTHNYFFDIHPPLAKLLIAGVGYMFGFTPLSHELVIGESFGSSSFIWLRLLPVIAGIVLPLIIYYLCKELKMSRTASLAAGFLIIFENSLLIQSRFVLLDSLLLAFGFFGLLLYFIYLRKRKLYVKIASIIFLTFAFSIKWTGGTFIAIVILLEIRRLIKEHRSFAAWIKSAALFLFIPVIIYFSLFAAHLSLLYKSGSGDAFMSKSFQKTLQGNTNNSDIIQASGLVSKIVELNMEMYRSNARLTATHPYGSKWYTWPVMQRPIYYWQQTTSSSTEARIYLLGNPLIYWLSTFAIIFTIFILLWILVNRTVVFNKKLALFLLFCYFLNLLPFIGITRVMFLYHYFTALVFSIITLVFLIDSIQNSNLKKKLATILICAALILFLYFSPLTYGLSISTSHDHLYFWFNSWI